MFGTFAFGWNEDVANVVTGRSVDRYRIGKPLQARRVTVVAVVQSFVEYLQIISAMPALAGHLSGCWRLPLKNGSI
ncbi:hypothetical protein [Verminephrobacter eiseniae]|uniref:hypothetical protein n=1 Tax=Verminephrobacter eiseniae TaxID=364317 RepID=UPI0022378FD0|nr:hypothetical protein [Verminephrobacter eiseniae]